MWNLAFIFISKIFYDLVSSEECIGLWIVPIVVPDNSSLVHTGSFYFAYYLSVTWGLLVR